MFYCDSCRIKRDWPESWARSYGKCEICDVVSSCNDVPSKHLSPPKLKERDGITYFTEADLPDFITKSPEEHLNKETCQSS